MQNLSFKRDVLASLLRRETFLYTVSSAILLTIFILTLINPLRVNRDASLHLLIGQLLLRGALPYVDYVEINPPLIHYLHVLPVALADWIGVNPIPVFLVLVLALSVGSIAGAIYLLSRNIPVEGYLIGGIAALAITVLDLKLFNTNEFGQREHIFLLQVMPYMILRWLRRRGRLANGNNLGVLVGLAAGIGVFIKPHFLIIIVAVELFWFISEGGRLLPRDPEAIAVFGVGLGYALFLLLMPGEARAGLTAVVESVITGGYQAYGNESLIGLILDNDILLLVGLLPFLFFRVRKNKDEAESFLLTMSVFALASLAVYGLQGRGFAYHLIPAMGAEYLIVFLLVFAVAPRLRSDVWREGRAQVEGPSGWVKFGRLLTATLVLIAVGKWIGDLSPNAIRGAASLPDADVIAVIRNNSAEDDGVLVVSTMAEPFRYVLQADRRLASKYIPTNPISFGISGIDDIGKLYDREFKLPSSVQSYLNELELTISKDSPALIIIDRRRSCVGCPEGFQVSEFLRSRGVYEEAIAVNYTLLLESGRVEIWKHVANVSAGGD
ncbi:MAG TPA: hypothetical protein VJK02_11170 [Anaerolineales bacterium]|nr:hypothetical protein [Anaerolineales bacterium]